MAVFCNLCDQKREATFFFLSDPPPPEFHPLPLPDPLRSSPIPAVCAPVPPMVPSSSTPTALWTSTRRIASVASSAFPDAPSTFRSSTRPRRRSTSARYRSEEHTPELQSQSNLVCRLLLEKK